MNSNLDVVKVDAAGPYRRGAPVSDKIEIFITIDEINTKQKIGKPFLRKIAGALGTSKVLTEEPVFLTKKIIGVIKIYSHHILELTVIPSSLRGVALLNSTGPQSYMVYIKEVAAQQGYKLNENGLYKLSTKDDKDIKIYTFEEKDIYEELRIPYTRPEDRF